MQEKCKSNAAMDQSSKENAAEVDAIDAYIRDNILNPKPRNNSYQQKLREAKIKQEVD